MRVFYLEYNSLVYVILEVMMTVEVMYKHAVAYTASMPQSSQKSK